MGELMEERVVDEAIRFLLDGLGVESLAELKRLVDTARIVEVGGGGYARLERVDGEGLNVLHWTP